MYLEPFMQQQVRTGGRAGKYFPEYDMCIPIHGSKGVDPPIFGFRSFVDVYILVHVIQQWTTTPSVSYHTYAECLDWK